MRIVDLQIEDVAFGGKGVGRDHGKAVFVPLTIDGEAISAKITREKKQFAEAELVQVRKPSPDRVEPPCPYFGRCGGCAYQHVDYPHQLEIKSRQVGDILRRIGKLENLPMRPIIPSPLAYGYRNRVTVHAQDGVIGYFQRDSRHLIDVERCPIAMDEVNRELEDLRARNVPDGHYTLRARSGPRVFSQTNDGVANALRDLVVDLTPANQQLLIDAYCGAGFFSKALLNKFEQVIGIDWDRFAIAAAKETETPKETYIAGNVEEELRRIHLNALSSQVPLQTQANLNANCIQVPTATDRAAVTLLVDPPATGLTARVRETIIDLSPATFIYVSCNPATLARDLGDLRQRFEIKSVTPLDMFPQTAEIEVVAHLQRFGDSAI